VTPPKKLNLVVIECDAALAGCALPAQGAVEAAKALGWHVALVNGASTPSLYNSLMEQAVSSGANAIITSALDPTLITAGLADANAHHIPVLSLAQEASDIGPKGFALDVSAGQYLVGQYAAAYVAIHSQGKADILVMDDREYTGTVHFIQGFFSEIKLCTTCTVNPTMYMVSTDIATLLQPRVEGYLEANPKVGWIIGPYDPVVTGALCPAIATAGDTGKVKVISDVGVPANIALIKKHGCQVADGVFPLLWNGWAGVDQLIRILDHVPTIKPAGENMTRSLVDIQHIPKGLTFDSDVNYESAYLTLWGVKH
jgi:ABC-type sugar transport system substrate-binding protein